MATVVKTGTGWNLYDDGTLEVSPSFSSNITSYDYRNDVTSVVFTGSLTKIDSYAFEKCTHLTSITIPATVTSIGGVAFSGCSSLESVYLSDGLKIIGNYAFEKCTHLTSITIPATVTSIGRSAFSGCSSLESVYFMLTKQSAWSLYKYTNYAFPSGVNIYCRGLDSIDITSQPEKTEYEDGETFDRTGMVVTANFNVGFTDSYSEVVTDYSAYPLVAPFYYSSGSPGSFYVIVSYTYDNVTVTTQVPVTIKLPVNSGDFTVRAMHDLYAPSIGTVHLTTDFQLTME